MGITSKNTNQNALASNVSSTKWFSSKEAMKQLGISGCELMHKRLNGELVFKKKGNAYLYRLDAPSK